MLWRPTLAYIGAELRQKHRKIIFIVLVLLVFLMIANIEEIYRNRINSPPILSSVSYRLGRRKFNTEAPCDQWINQEDVRLSTTRKPEFKSKQYLSELALEYIEKNDDFTIKPRQIQFVQGSRNPCWMERDGKRCLPSFFMAGFSKSGTTDLWYHLIRHKHILSDYDEKEPCWWGWRRISSDTPNLYKKVPCTAKQKCKITMSQYLENFHHKNRDLLIGDGSTDNIWNNDLMSGLINNSRWSRAPSERLVKALSDFRLPQAYLIQHYTPNTKYILILRDPADRLYSAYKFAHYRNPRLKGVKPSQENFHHKVVFAIELFNKCLISTNDIRHCAYSPEIRRKQKTFPVTIQKALYVIFITDVLKLVDRENVHFIHFDEYHKSRAGVLEKVFQFLGVDPDQELISQVEEEENSHAENSSKDQQTDIGPMWDKTRAALRRFYRPFNRELALLLGDQRFLFE